MAATVVPTVAVAICGALTNMRDSMNSCASENAYSALQFDVATTDGV